MLLPSISCTHLLGLLLAHFCITGKCALRELVCAQIPLAILVLLSTELQADRLYSKSPLTWQLVTTTAGYFLYDFYVHSVRFEYTANLVHAAAALAVFLTGISCGMLHYYGEHSPLQVVMRCMLSFSGTLCLSLWQRRCCMSKRASWLWCGCCQPPFAAMWAAVSAPLVQRAESLRALSGGCLPAFPLSPAGSQTRVSLVQFFF